ncbi:diguanylate cyclase [Calidithermus roseus]|uniref:Diguanylate cyclase DosC n=1 Tax=Calidithermus roseus TaxID=1644118 RepID=A0A399F174_9DEIN|nr:diguanylate cyclase [Calidithermus roseus]RIH89813.1 Diguanylate cyclase DosC [Calidithermus roseus]
MTGATTLDRERFYQSLANWKDDGPISVAVADIDEFLAVNQNYGREVGNAVIALVMKALAGSLPPGSLLTRLGGDEFACALPGASPEEALIQLEEIRQYLAGRKHNVGEVSLAVRLSIGIASFPRHVSDPQQLLQAADEALLRAKREGRSRVAIYVEDRMVLKSNYYPKNQLARLATLSERLGRTEAALLREALADLLDKYREFL